MAFRIQIIPPPQPAGLRGSAPRRILNEEMMRTANQMNQLVFNTVRKVSPVGATQVLQRGWQRTLARMVGRNAVAVTAAVGAAGLEANVLENGATSHFPPVPEQGEPALGAWIRSKLPRLTVPFVQDGRRRRPADLNNPRDVRAIAFKISQAINRRGLPGPQRGVTKIFSSAIAKIEPALRIVLGQMSPRIVRRISRR